MRMEIRDYAPGDRGGVIDAMVAAEMFAREDAPFLEEVLDRHATAAPEESRCLVAVSDGTVIGAALARAEEATDRAWDLTMIGVRTDLQNQGAGRALMAAMESLLSGDGARLVLVRTSATDQFAGARAFYERLDYDRVARIDDYWADGDDLIVFRRRMRQG